MSPMDSPLAQKTSDSSMEVNVTVKVPNKTLLSVISVIAVMISLIL